ncbi:hypothetical protein CSUI_008191 [Cystoisospora suis]|uniref:Uncharacterized protein n=1 Tax=Cystoisospora suis TaxID=483139 RepID=A0A2C6KNA5_9APIC|nr:hypothetical protein CSUI_008191 [Cystoisospora suis]
MKRTLLSPKHVSQRRGEKNKKEEEIFINLNRHVSLRRKVKYRKVKKKNEKRTLIQMWDGEVLPRLHTRDEKETRREKSSAAVETISF